MRHAAAVIALPLLAALAATSVPLAQASLDDAFRTFWSAENPSQAAAAGEAPVLVCSGGVRGHVRAIVERFRPMTAVLAQAEIHPRARIRTVGSV